MDKREQEEREWKQVKEIYQQNTTKRNLGRRKNVQSNNKPWQNKQENLNWKKGLIFKRTFLEALSKKHLSIGRIGNLKLNGH